MTAHPKRKTPHSKQGLRRGHHHITVGSIILCSHCRHPHLAHHVCPNCGYYRGREVVPEKVTTPAE